MSQEKSESSHTIQLNIVINDLKAILVLLSSQLKKNPFPNVNNDNEIYESSENEMLYFTAVNELHALINTKIIPYVQQICEKISTDNIAEYLEKLLSSLKANNEISSDQYDQIEKIKLTFSLLFENIKKTYVYLDYVIDHVNSRDKKRRENDNNIIKSTRELNAIIEKHFNIPSESPESTEQKNNVLNLNNKSESKIADISNFSKLYIDITKLIWLLLDPITISQFSQTNRFYRKVFEEMEITKDENNQSVTFKRLQTELNKLPKLPLCLLKHLFSTQDFWMKLKKLQQQLAIKVMPTITSLSYRMVTLSLDDMLDAGRSRSDYENVALFFNIIPKEDLRQSNIINGLLKNQTTAIPLLGGLYENLFTLRDVSTFIRHPVSGSYTFTYIDIFFNPAGMKILRAKLLTVGQASDIPQLPALLTEEGFIALNEKLITKEEYMQFFDSCDARRCQQLSHLLSSNGIKALRNKLITPKQALEINELDILLSDVGLKALEENLLTPEEAHLFCSAFPPSLAVLLNEYGIIGLKEKLFTVKEASGITNLHHLLTKNGITALRERLFDLKQAKLLDKILEHLLSDESLSAIRSNTLSLKLLIDVEHLRCEYGIKILINKLIDPAKFNIHQWYSLKDILFNKYGYIALQEKMIKPEQAISNNCGNIQALLNDHGITALREQLITVEIALQFRDRHELEQLMTPSGLNALRSGLINSNEVTRISCLKSIVNEPGLSALRKKLVTISELQRLSIYPPALIQLMTEVGIKALEDKIISVDDVIKYRESMYGVLTVNGLKALQRGLINLEQMTKVNMIALMNDNGFQALEEGLITPSEAALIRPQLGNLFSNNENGLSLLREKHITPTQIIGFSEQNMMVLTSDEVLNAFRKNLINLDYIKNSNKSYFELIAIIKDLVPPSLRV